MTLKDLDTLAAELYATRGGTFDDNRELLRLATLHILHKQKEAIEAMIKQFEGAAR